MATVDAVARSPLNVELQLEPVDNPGGTVHVAGTVRVDGRSSRRFSGWLDLLQVLEALVEADQ